MSYEFIMNAGFLRIGIAFLVSVVLINTYCMNLFLIRLFDIIMLLTTMVNS